MFGFRAGRVKKALARATLGLLARRESDLARWSDPRNLQAEWDERAAMAARHVLPGQPVLDLGCGAMALERFLPPGTPYRPADIVARRADCLVIDLNRGEFPEGRFGSVTLLGVLEYLYEPEAVLRRARLAAGRLVLSYAIDLGQKPEKRRANGWVNDFKEAEIRRLLEASGWRLVEQSPIRVRRKVRHDLFVCDDEPG
ncbi:MAG: hypothetical protein KIT81_16945 [Alphaproteobacteria bacterium]|nr:hypothetical protein [Alphaproteobacteria bacterium]